MDHNTTRKTPTIPPDVEEWISALDAERILKAGGLRVSRVAIEKWMANGYLQYVRLPSGRRRVRVSDIKAILTPLTAADEQDQLAS
ncbi:MerR family transcriptional regulator [Amycolatopsis thermophila]|uniref:Helix-turn-helix domain-containing protein n=1 Tax=Amycolatopsis thermophila TaxID=206084 RepID=A0ABU0EN65_9PSEU|nr:hypothetical protein [Amycolatopsis thermophila]MDQ0376614.1 hypothetical protein [Amycolatopsis thermophila]